MLHGASVPRGLGTAPRRGAGRFGRLFPGRPACEAGEPEIDALDALLKRRADIHQNSSIPAGFTYLGQFVDHDITFDPTPLTDRRRDPDALVNFRTPRLDLDSLYGLGPDVQPYLYDWDTPPAGARFLLGGRDGVVDLPRTSQGRAVIGDPRNDENAIVSQLHLLFLRFHNAVVDGLGGGEGAFERARRIVRRHYQWIVLDQFLPRITGTAVADVLRSGREHFRWEREPFIPLEFSGAAYRFGHSMVREDYGIRALPEDGPGEPAVPLFPGLAGHRPLVAERVIDWERFFPLGGEHPQASLSIDTTFAPVVFRLPDGEPSLPRRNLLRGRKLELPSGQEVADAMRAPVLSDLLLGDDVAAPAREVLERSTPLWYYLLCEAEHGGGRRLGPMGARIVAEVLVGLLEGDPESLLGEEPGWEPGELDGEKGAFTMASLVRFAQG